MIHNMKKNSDGVPGIYSDDFTGGWLEVAQHISAISDHIQEIAEIVHDLTVEIDDYRAYLVYCIKDVGCGYRDEELDRFSVGILENIFVNVGACDVDYRRFVDEKGGVADEK